MSEKLDGIRGYWDGFKMLSKNGKQIQCPKWFVEQLPTDPLDGELWMGPGTTASHMMKLVHTRDADWKEVGYYVFDLPASPGIWEERMKQLEQLKQKFPSHVHVIENILCSGTEHLLEYLTSILDNKG